MALTHWIFLYVADGLAPDGQVHHVTNDASTSVLAGFPNTTAAIQSCLSGSLASAFETTQLVECCGAFSHADVVELRRAQPATPVGIVSYSGEMTTELHSIFS